LVLRPLRSLGQLLGMACFPGSAPAYEKSTPRSVSNALRTLTRVTVVKVDNEGQTSLLHPFGIVQSIVEIVCASGPDPDPSGVRALRGDDILKVLPLTAVHIRFPGRFDLGHGGDVCTAVGESNRALEEGEGEPGEEDRECECSHYTGVERKSG
jgi:hypothetical protein